MYISITKPERDHFLSETNDSLMPGYTGHCPTLKFRFGKRYGASTKEIIREMGERGLWSKQLTGKASYRQNDPLKGLFQAGELRPIERVKGEYQLNTVTPGNRSRPYILGYTGFIPGMNFTYGKSYAQAADESMTKFTIKKAALESKKALETTLRNRERQEQVMQPTYPHDKLTEALMDYDCKHRYKDEHISPEQPPIAGYTGHIPRIKSTEASLSQRYHTAAKRGLYLLQQDRQRLKAVDNFETSLSKANLPIQTAVF
ncbi:ciliary microtubule inner protein 2B-like isoform X2 [Rhodnius prolixus]|uniref:ciliary microtubule inner protein 2B-like isoform X2 n=1 Tax=Rhodnius prolixus TaxID=13249 RepID=UPI003D18B2D6